MEAVFYSIDEKAARAAHQLNSMYPFAPGAATREYQDNVQEAYDMAERVKETNPERVEEAFVLANKYAYKLACWYNKNFNINAQYPSVLISGPSDFNNAKKEKQNRAREKHLDELAYIEKLKSSLYFLATKKASIKAADENAIEKLEEKIADLSDLQEKMKAANACYRKNETLEGFSGMSDKEAKEKMKDMKQSWHPSDVPFASFTLSNNRQRLKATQDRLDSLKVAKEKGTQKRKANIKGEEVEILENAEIMRLQIIFNEKPNEEIRSLLKKHAFKWSPKNNAWQRQLTDNARYALKRLISL